MIIVSLLGQLSLPDYEYAQERENSYKTDLLDIAVTVMIPPWRSRTLPITVSGSWMI